MTSGAAVSVIAIHSLVTVRADLPDAAGHPHVIVGAEDEMASLREAQAAQRGGTQQSADEAAAVLKAAKESRAPRRRRSAKKAFQSP